jgi:hypothetical protein
VVLLKKKGIGDGGKKFHCSYTFRRLHVTPLEHCPSCATSGCRTPRPPSPAVPPRHPLRRRRWWPRHPANALRLSQQIRSTAPSSRLQWHDDVCDCYENFQNFHIFSHTSGEN